MEKQLKPSDFAMPTNSMTGNAAADLQGTAAIAKQKGVVSAANEAAEAGIDYLQSVVKLGRWEDLGYVPVFATRNAFFAGRDRGSKSGIIAKLKVDDKVNFMPFRDWGTGTVETQDGFTGWVDRACIEES